MPIFLSASRVLISMNITQKHSRYTQSMPRMTVVTMGLRSREFEGAEFARLQSAIREAIAYRSIAICHLERRGCVNLHGSTAAPMQRLGPCRKVDFDGGRKAG
ncbi:hypothetical protein [Pseudomonas argentinensis]|uniref:hypothetical protein n=1 Tax=Phytopseudomonas argentinensis TaxID=289370 RepID=UPI0014819D64|nr:hypothetical protein [Pseudomonas argentinensis]